MSVCDHVLLFVTGVVATAASHITSSRLFNSIIDHLQQHTVTITL